MTEHALLGPVGSAASCSSTSSPSRNLAANTQRSYRDTLRLLLPFAARSSLQGD